MLQPAQTTPEASATQKAEVAAENVMTVAKDPRYARYLKMVQVVSYYYCCCGYLRNGLVLCLNVMFNVPQGVPVMAIRNKMVMEGLDPNLLEWVFFKLLFWLLPVFW